MVSQDNDSKPQDSNPQVTDNIISGLRKALEKKAFGAPAENLNNTSSPDSSSPIAPDEPIFPKSAKTAETVSPSESTVHFETVPDSQHEPMKPEDTLPPAPPSSTSVTAIAPSSASSETLSETETGKLPRVSKISVSSQTRHSSDGSEEIATSKESSALSPEPNESSLKASLGKKLESARKNAGNLGTLSGIVSLAKEKAEDKEEATKLTRWAILGALAITLLILFIWGIKSLLAPIDNFLQAGYDSPRHQGAVAPAKPIPSKEAPTQKKTPQEQSPATLPAPVIESIEQRSPDGPNADHPELLTSLFDGNPETTWRSRYFPRTTFRSGAIEFAIKLKEPSEISKLTMFTKATGGKFTLLSASNEDPWKGKVISQGVFNNQVNLSFSPIKTQRLVLQINELPKGHQGKNRAWIGELKFSK
ncbi:hypothetical protein KRX54_01695 [Actinomycetaceae bacterium TAE3-ERU4]|nr:hypothetical protein [Actinomycetaceae bacterium TAE3-ERU4]